MLKVISSMATRLLLADLAAQWQLATGNAIHIESVGGLDAAKRVRAGEAFDGVVLAHDAIDKLIASGHVSAASRTDIALSYVAAAVKIGTAQPDISTESALRRAVEAAPTIGYSSGPSGVAVCQLFERWGILNDLQERIVQTPPGVPVGDLVASGQVALGFQQLSELMHLGGISVLRPLPDEVAMPTVFSAAACTLCTQRALLNDFVSFMTSDHACLAIARHGMSSAKIQ